MRRLNEFEMTDELVYELIGRIRGEIENDGFLGSENKMGRHAMELDKKWAKLYYFSEKGKKTTTDIVGYYSIENDWCEVSNYKISEGVI